ncbi:hypothetical protein ACC691_41155, partial [Rhizobium johnstonii]|uniref:hypothetical protein n=1 Tax=Rhizobium johnstonii TaxID=3019933 RepID=UPI003F9E5316
KRKKEKERKEEEGREEKEGKEGERAGGQGNFPGVAINSQGMLLFPVIRAGLNLFGKPQSLQRHPASVNPRMEAHTCNS